MKYLFILLLGIGFTQSLIENVTESYGDGMPKEIKYYKSISNKLELFTAKGYHKNGQIRYEIKYRDGK